MRTVLCFGVLLSLLLISPGCAEQKQGDEEFYQRHPQYKEAPDYFNAEPPADR